MSERGADPSPQTPPVDAPFLTYKAEVGPVDIVSFLFGLAALILSIFAFVSTADIAKSQSTIGIISGFTSDSMANATKEMVEAAATPVAMTILDFADYQSRIAPLSNQLMAAAACMARDICDERIVGPIFCARALDFEKLYIPVRKQAVPEATDDPVVRFDFYQAAVAECRKVSS
jgi:hypothetical protein